MALVAVRVTPRSAKPGIGSWQADPSGRPYLEVRVAAAPADGAANEELVKLLAKALALPRSAVSITGGHGSRMKRMEVSLEMDEIRSRLAG